MSFHIIYNRLAAVNILHNFYLDKEGSPYYGLSAADQETRMAELLMDARYNLMDDLLITPTPATEKLLRGQKIAFRQTTTGLILGVDATGNTPTIALNGQLRLQFMIKLKNAAFVSRSNLKVNPTFPASYYFTNDSITTGKLLPSLSAAVQPIVEGRIYEMGEWATIAGVVSQAITRTNTAAAGWAATPDAHTINEYDRILVPAEFPYTFDVPGLTTATFKLMKGAVEVRSLVFNNPNGLQQVDLDFKKPADDVYTLSVTGSNNYKRDYSIYLHKQLYQREAWGVLDLVMHPADAASRLIDDNGLLLLPTFELRFSSRSTYWKYYLQKGEPLVPDLTWNEVTPVPQGMKKVIISKEPYPLMQAYRKVNYATVPLPNPEGDTISRQGDLITSEILLPKLKL
jgi:hypothetical protein